MWHPTVASGECVRYGRWDDIPFEEISCVYPLWGKTFMQWEYPSNLFYRTWDFLESNNWFPVVAVSLYVVVIHAGQAYMKNREALKWRNSLAAWNLLLAVFSCVGFMRMFTKLSHNFYHYGFRDNLCAPAEQIVGSGSTSVWGMLFTFSKFAELFDTFFIVIHKKKLMFLHWYHHVTVLLCCWHTWVTLTPTGLIFSTVNFGVHSVMYFYYFLMAIRCRPKWFNPIAITITQIIQMVAGVVVTFSALFYVHQGNCAADLTNIQGTLVMYASYLLLFMKFFFERYGIKTSNAKKSV